MSNSLVGLVTCKGQEFRHLFACFIVIHESLATRCRQIESSQRASDKASPSINILVLPVSVVDERDQFTQSYVWQKDWPLRNNTIQWKNGKWLSVESLYYTKNGNGLRRGQRKQSWTAGRVCAINHNLSQWCRFVRLFLAIMVWSTFDLIKIVV